MKTKIEYHPERIRDTTCFQVLSTYDDFKYRDCLGCAFYKPGDYCCWKEYHVVFKRKEYTEDDCVPSTYYQWKFPCVKCGKEIEYRSDMSNISHQALIECEHCNTPHVLMKGGYDEGTFYVPESKD